MLIAFAASLILVLLWLTVGPGARAGDGDASADGGITAAGVQARTAVVGPDDTLWAIAEAADPGADPRVIVQRIITLNGLAGAIVQPGQRLRLPAR